MVQLKASRSAKAKANIHHEYWKLDNLSHLNKVEMFAKLKELNYPCPASITKADMINYYLRYQTGLMSYDQCSREDLLKYVQQRGLSAVKSKKPRKQDLITALIEGDTSKTFRIMDLPPELRVRIYTFYFYSLKALDRPAQPPLSLVSRLIRKEALPVFYQKCTFVLDVMKIRTNQTAQTNGARGRAIFWCDVPEEHIRMIIKLEIRACVIMKSLDYWPLRRYASWLVDLNPRAIEGVTFCGTERQYRAYEKHSVVHPLKPTERLKALIGNLQTKGERGMLSWEVIKTIKKMFQQCCKEDQA